MIRTAPEAPPKPVEVTPETPDIGRLKPEELKALRRKQAAARRGLELGKPVLKGTTDG